MKNLHNIFDIIDTKLTKKIHTPNNKTLADIGIYEHCFYTLEKNNVTVYYYEQTDLFREIQEKLLNIKPHAISFYLRLEEQLQNNVGSHKNSK